MLLATYVQECQRVAGRVQDREQNHRQQDQNERTDIQENQRKE